MSREMRRSRQEMSEQKAQEVIARNNAGVLSLLGDEGYPYGVPISYAYADGNFYFHSALQGHKVDAIKGNSKASFTIIDANDLVPEEYTTYFRSVIAIGEVEIIEDDDEKLETIKLLSQKVRPGYEDQMNETIKKEWDRFLMIKLTPHEIRGKEAIELVKIK